MQDRNRCAVKKTGKAPGGELKETDLTRQMQQIVQDSCYYAGAYAIDQYGPGDLEHLAGGAQDHSYRLEFHGRRDDGVGKAGNGHHGACSGKRGDPVKNAQGGQKTGKENQRQGNDGTGSFRILCKIQQ